MSGAAKMISKLSARREFSGSASEVVKKKPAKRLPPLSLRLSESERAELRHLAGNRPLGSYIKGRLFQGDNSGAQPRPRQPASHDRKLLAELLRALAQADVIRTVGDIRRACQDESLVLSDEAELAVHQACTDISEMRKNLVVALGLKPGAQP